MDPVGAAVLEPPELSSSLPTLWRTGLRLQMNYSEGIPSF